MTRYSKSIIALLGALATWGVTAAEDNSYTQVELWGLLAALATAVGVYALPNVEPSDPEQGQANLAAIAAVLVIVLVVLLARTL